MHFSNVFLFVGATAFCIEASVASRGLNNHQMDLIHKIPHILKKMYSNLNANDLILRQDPIEDPLPIEGGDEIFSIDNSPISGRLTWGNGSVKGLSLLTYNESPILECSYNPGDTMFTWEGAVPNVILEIPSFDFSIGYYSPEFSINVITITGTDLELGISDAFASAVAKGNCNDDEIIVGRLELNLGANFLTTANGQVMLNGDDINLIDIRNELNSLFETAWNDRTQPLFENYLRCAVNIALENCTDATIATCAQEPGINNENCIKELDDLRALPVFSGTGTAFVSWFSITILAWMSLVNIW